MPDAYKKFAKRDNNYQLVQGLQFRMRIMEFELAMLSIKNGPRQVQIGKIGVSYRQSGAKIEDSSVLGQ